MTPWVLALSGVTVVAALAALTGAGSRRRGASWPLAIVEGALFPLTWVTWYVQDEALWGHPRGR